MNTKLHELEQRIDRLEAYIATLESHIALPGQECRIPTKLVAPVQIVDADGRLLASIERRANDVSLRIFNQDGIATATLGLDGTQAGYLAIRNAEGVLVALLDVESYGTRLHLDSHHRKGGITLFGGDTGDDAGGGVHIHHTAGGLSIALWSTPSGGEITLYDGQSEGTLLTSLPPHPSAPEDTQS